MTNGNENFALFPFETALFPFENGLMTNENENNRKILFPFVFQMKIMSIIFIRVQMEIMK